MDNINISIAIAYLLGITLTLLTIRGLVKLVIWSKRMPKGAFVFLAVFPILSLFPIPPQEIKKLERIKQEQIQEEDENGEPSEGKKSPNK